MGVTPTAQWAETLPTTYTYASEPEIIDGKEVWIATGIKINTGGVVINPGTTGGGTAV